MVMNIPAFEGTTAFEWALFYDENGYYQAANKFDSFIEQIEETDIDLSEEHTAEEFEEELTMEEVAGALAFTRLSVRMLDQWTEEDLEDMVFNGALDSSLEQYLDEKE